MIRIFQDRWNESDYKDHPKVKLNYLDEWAEFETDSEVKNIVICKANNEKLPFSDDYFQAYVANMSLHLVANHKNQLAEAYRVLQPGGYAGFSVWGREETTNYFAFLKNTLHKLGFAHPLQSIKNFHLADAKKLREDVLEAGFSVVK